ncbi:hypothetical protein HK102_010986 [Quaeritorhiza haematococci]|nr:hypothetical protein HK102_010986 [Quaeritorhiza haematococci]
MLVSAIVGRLRRLSAGDLQHQQQAMHNGIVAALRELAELLVWSDKKDRIDIFDQFVEEKVHLLLMKFVLGGDDTLQLELLRFFNMLLEGVQHNNLLYFLYSNNYINEIIGVKYNIRNDETMSYLLSLMKNLSIKLNSENIHLMYNEHFNDFPLYREAVKYLHHEEHMIKIAVDDDQATRFILERRLFNGLAQTICTECVSITQFLESGRPSERLEAEEKVEDVLDQLLYIQDILSLKLKRVTTLLNGSVLDFLVKPLVRTLTETGHAKVISWLQDPELLAMCVREIFTSRCMYFPSFTGASCGFPQVYRYILITSSTTKASSESPSASERFSPVPQRTSVSHAAILDSLNRADSDAHISLALALLYAILRNPAVPQEALREVGLYPRRQYKSRLLLEELTSTETSPFDTVDSPLGHASSPSLIPYNEELVQSLIPILDAKSDSSIATPSSPYRFVTVQLCCQVLLELTATVKFQSLNPTHMESLEAARAKWKLGLEDALQVHPHSVAKIFEYESRQIQVWDLNPLVRDPRLIFQPLETLIPTQSQSTTQTAAVVNPSHPPSSALDATIQADMPLMDKVDRCAKMWLLLTECLRQLGKPSDELVAFLRQASARRKGTTDQGTEEKSIKLTGRDIAVCTLHEQFPVDNAANDSVGDQSASVSGCYFVFDEEDLLLVEPDRLRLGMGRVRKRADLMDTEVINVGDSDLAITVTKTPLLFIPDAQRRSPQTVLSLQESFRVTIPVASPNVMSREAECWQARILFNTAAQREKALNHLLQRRTQMIDNAKILVGLCLRSASTVA